MEKKNGGWTDPLEQLIKYHKYVSEYIIDFEKFSELSHDPGLIEKPEFEEFLNRYFYEHFAFESRKIFPVLISKIGGPKMIKLVRELELEHEQMLEKVSRLKKSVKKGETGSDVHMLAREVFSELVEHGAKEDDELIPVINENSHLFNL